MCEVCKECVYIYMCCVWCVCTCYIYIWYMLCAMCSIYVYLYGVCIMVCVWYIYDTVYIHRVYGRGMLIVYMCDEYEYLHDV